MNYKTQAHAQVEADYLTEKYNKSYAVTKTLYGKFGIIGGIYAIEHFTKYRIVSITIPKRWIYSQQN